MNEIRERLLRTPHVLGTFERDGGGQMRVALRAFEETPYLELARLGADGKPLAVVAIKREEFVRLRELVTRAKALTLGAEEASPDAAAQALVGLAPPVKVVCALTRPRKKKATAR